MSGAPTLLPPDPPEPAPSPAPRPKQIVCEYCQCQLTPSGEYITLSERAKGLRDQGERIDQLKGDLAAVQADLAEASRLLDEANAKIRTLEAPPTGKKALW